MGLTGTDHVFSSLKHLRQRFVILFAWPPGLPHVFLEASQVESVVVIGEETRLPVVAALNDVHRYVRQRQSSATRHESP